jgi:threonine/homoserine/homoserine lactone efflux protein
MIGTINLTTFIITGIGLNLYPGPDTMYIISRSLSQGKKAGIMSVWGISTGGLCHTLFAGIGLSAILIANPNAFKFVKIIGSIYLIYLGIRCIINRKHKNDIDTDTYLSQQNNFQIYKQGLFTNLFNPKVALFFLSFLPQFVDPINNYGFLTFIFLGSIFLTTGTLWCLIIAIFAAKISIKIRQNKNSIFYLEKLTGLLYIIIGIFIYL